MHFFSIEEHDNNCYYNRPNFFLFQYQYDFYCVFYCSCHQGYSHLDFKLQLIKSVAKNIGKPERYNKYNQSNINKGINLKECIRDRKIEYLLSRNMIEVCSIYSDMVGKEYCFGVENTYSDFLANNINYNNNYYKAWNQIKEKNIFTEELISNLHLLYQHNDNQFSELSDIQKINLTKLLSKNFIKTYTHDYKSHKL